MEIKNTGFSFSKLLLKDPLPFTKKRDFNWRFIGVSLAATIIGVVLLILILPTPKSEQKIFYEKADSRKNTSVTQAASAPHENNPTEDTLAQLQSARGHAGSFPKSLDYLYQPSVQSGGSSANRNSAMVIARSGLDAKTQLPPGSKFAITLDRSMTLDSHTMPIIATVQRDVIQEDGTAIPQGSKLYGDAGFDDSSERVQVNWKSVQFPNGMMKPLSAIGIGSDGQVGLDGDVHSDALKNSIGQTVTRFIGAYAEGSMQRGALGSNPGGEENGFKNAIAETAKDQTNSWAEGMKKERKWVDLKAGTVFYVVVTQAFQFRDPGAVYGR